MAVANGLDPADFPVAPPADNRPDRFGYHLVPGAADVVRYHHYTDPRTIRTIEDFVDFAGRLSVPVERVRMEAAAGPDGDAARSGALLRRIAG